MKLSIIIDLENSAFKPFPNDEIARILINYANAIKEGDPLEKRFFDINGNTVGLSDLKSEHI